MRLCWRALNGQEAGEEGAVAAQGLAQIFGGDVFVFVPLGLEVAAFLGEDFGEALHGFGDERVGLLDGAAGFVDEADLDGVPAGAKIFGFVGGEERTGLFLESAGSGGSGGLRRGGVRDSSGGFGWKRVGGKFLYFAFDYVFEFFAV